MRRRVAAVAVVSGFVVVGWAAPAAAHVDMDPAEVPAATEQVVGFVVGHGCAGSPTVRLDMQLPDGVTGASPEPIDGWTTSVDGDVVTWAGGPLAEDAELAFQVRLIVPMEPGETLYFPSVQTCEEGAIRWIQRPDDSGQELDQPAPALLLLDPPDGVTAAPVPDATAAPVPPSAPVPSTAAVTTVAPPTTAPPTTVPPSRSTPPSPPSSAPPVTRPAGDEVAADVRVDAGGGGSGVAVATGVGAVALVAVAGGVVIARRRSS